MAVAGIVAEYNPFHTGHLYHITQTRAMLGSGKTCPVIAVMSGNFVQRGDFAVFSKHARAEAACAAPGGPDLVIELPTPYACASAERFSRAAVSLLDDCGVVTHLSFGSEAGEIPPLARVADAIDSEVFAANLKEEIQSGDPFPTARQSAVARLLGPDAALLRTPNNTLGIEYLRALRKLGSTIKPITMKRIGSDHDSDYSDGDVASASLIRSMIFNGKAYSAMRYIPEGAIEVMIREMSRGAGPIRISMSDQAILAELRRMRAEDFEKLPDVREGLHYRLYNTVKEARSAEEAADLAKSKRYTHSRIRRILINAYLGIPSKWETIRPPYLKILAFNDTGRELLRSMKEKSRIPVISKPADASALWDEASAAADAAKRAQMKELFETEVRATDLYMLACPSPEYRKAGYDVTTSPSFVRSAARVQAQ